jgi:ADP-heptose:LPS heptosyltransferase
MNINSDYAEKWKLFKDKANGKKVIGLNTGCGKRWSTRLWSTENWIGLIKQLQNAGYYPIVLGGLDEDAQNKIYAQETNCYYPGTYSLEEFIAMASNCDIIVSAVSMMMHIAIGLQKQLVLFNNIFNKHEFEMYGRGEIIEPTSGCDCFYGNTCKRGDENNCMKDISVDAIFSAVARLANNIN